MLSHHHCSQARVCPVHYFCHITGTARSEDMDVKKFKNTCRLVLPISTLTLLKTQECLCALWAVTLRHLSLYSNLIINPCLIAPSDSVCLTNSEKTQAINVSHLLSTVYFNLSLIWHGMPTCCWAASLTPALLWFKSAGWRRTEYIHYFIVFWF